VSHILPNEAKLLYITSFKRQGHKITKNKKKGGGNKTKGKKALLGGEAFLI